MHPPETIQTARCILRLPQKSDATTFFDKIGSNQDIVKFLTWKKHKNIQETEAYIERILSKWNDKSSFSWCITLTQTNELVGMFDLFLGNYYASIGCIIIKDYWNQKLAPEVTIEIVNWSISQPQIYRVWALCDIENKSSSRALEKSGLELEGILHRWMIHPNISNEPRDCLSYARYK